MEYIRYLREKKMRYSTLEQELTINELKELNEFESKHQERLKLLNAIFQDATKDNSNFYYKGYTEKE